MFRTLHGGWPEIEHLHIARGGLEGVDFPYTACASAMESGVKDTLCLLTLHKEHADDMCYSSKVITNLAHTLQAKHVAKAFELRIDAIPCRIVWFNLHWLSQSHIMLIIHSMFIMMSLPPSYLKEVPVEVHSLRLRNQTQPCLPHLSRPDCSNFHFWCIS